MKKPFRTTVQPSESAMIGILGVGKITTFSEKTKSLPLRPDPSGLHLQPGKSANIVPQEVFGAAFRRTLRSCLRTGETARTTGKA
ncbi:MAG: hypothetical protein K2O82_02775, partial [Alistipes sp.]|nr:hypothetical protein [Alistipes sp.]